MAAVALSILGSDAWGERRPRVRAECESGPRPCPWVSCKYHLMLDVKENGKLKVNFPTEDIGDPKETCALDVAEQGWHTLEEVGELMNLTRERVRQIETRALIAARRELAAAEMFEGRHAELPSHDCR